MESLPRQTNPIESSTMWRMRAGHLMVASIITAVLLVMPIAGAFLGTFIGHLAELTRAT